MLPVNSSDYISGRICGSGYIHQFLLSPYFFAEKKPGPSKLYLDVPLEVSMVIGSMGYFTYS